MGSYETICELIHLTKVVTQAKQVLWHVLERLHDGLSYHVNIETCCGQGTERRSCVNECNHEITTAVTSG